MKSATVINKRQGIVFILSAPSGTGKTTVITGLLERFPEISLSVSYTTRAPRAAEVPGRDYYFITRRMLDRAIRSGRDFFLDIDVQGARQIKRKYPNAVAIFLLPPSWSELRRRLGGRATDNPAIIRRRLANARREIRDVIQYDYYIVNSDIIEAVETLEAIILAERQKISRITRWGIAPLRRQAKHLQGSE
jgi:guanylate kinase